MLDTAEGAFEEAARRLEEAIDLAGQVWWAMPVRYMRSHRAELDLLQGRPRAALARLRPLADAADLDWNYSTILLSVLARAHLELGDAAKAEEVADRAIGEAEPMHNRLDAVGALRVKGMAQSQQGRWDEAAGTLEEGLAMARSMPYPHAEACILHEYGVLHARKGEPERARERLRAALAAFGGLGAARDAQRTQRELLALGPG